MAASDPDLAPVPSPAAATSVSAPVSGAVSNVGEPPTAAPTAPSEAESCQSPATPISDFMKRIFGEPSPLQEVGDADVAGPEAGRPMIADDAADDAAPPGHTEASASEHSTPIDSADALSAAPAIRPGNSVEGTPEKKRARLRELEHEAGDGERQPQSELGVVSVGAGVNFVEPPPGLDHPMTQAERRERQPGWIRQIALDYERQLQQLGGGPTGPESASAMAPGEWSGDALTYSNGVSEISFHISTKKWKHMNDAKNHEVRLADISAEDKQRFSLSDVAELGYSRCLLLVRAARRARESRGPAALGRRRLPLRRGPQ